MHYLMHKYKAKICTAYCIKPQHNYWYLQLKTLINRNPHLYLKLQCRSAQ
jgi:hypothetical protein